MNFFCFDYINAPNNKNYTFFFLNFCRPRWALFIFYLKEAIVKGIDFDQARFESDVFTNIEEVFTFDKTVFTSEPAGNRNDFNYVCVVLHHLLKL